MPEDEAILYDLLTELLHNKRVSDPTYARALAKFGEPGIVEATSLAGYYAMLAMVMNTARTPVPAGATPGAHGVSLASSLLEKRASRLREQLASVKVRPHERQVPTTETKQTLASSVSARMTSTSIVPPAGRADLLRLHGVSLRWIP